MKSVRLLAAGLGAAALAALSFPGVVINEVSNISQANGFASGKGMQNPDKPHSSKLRAILGSGMGSWGSKQRRAGYGWTNAHAQRVARKKRNQAKHRASSRGRSRA
jgi:hypothetical protein